MTTYIALFRGINVGGKRPLPMKSLRELLVGLGLQRVETYIQSGNVVFQSDESRDELRDAIGTAVLQHHGFAPQLLILNGPELLTAIEDNPYHSAEGKALHLFFLLSPTVAPELKRLADRKSETESFELRGNFVSLCPRGDRPLTTGITD